MFKTSWKVFALLVFVLPLVAQDFRITDIRLNSGGHPRVTFQAAPNYYYILLGGDSDSIADPKKLTLGRNGSAEIADTNASPFALWRFYQVARVPQNAPYDTDGDGIDDVTELRSPDFLDPLNPADADEDDDGDGQTNLQEYESLDDPFVSNVAPIGGKPYPATIGFSNLRVVAKTGQADTSGRLIQDIFPYPSINDNGLIAFRGRVVTPDGVRRLNVYVADPTSGSVRPLLKSNSEFELSEDGRAPGQAFNAPQINNQNVVLAWRVMYCRVQVAGSIQDGAPFTYLEKWPANQTDFPIELVASGDNAVGSLYPNQLTFIRPITGNLFPSPFNPYTAWDVLPGFNNDCFPSINNQGNCAFTAHTKDGAYYLATSATPTPASAIRLTSNARRTRIADDGTVVTLLRENNTPELSVFSYDLRTKTTLASTSSGWTSLGQSPAISDDGSCVAFYGDLSAAKASDLNLTSGPGVFAAVREGQSWRLFRLNGVSGNGQLDPGEDDSEGFSQDKGIFSSFIMDDRCGVGNSKSIVYLATLTNGHRAVVSTRLDITAPAGYSPVSEPSIVAEVEQEIPEDSRTAIKSVGIYDPIDNSSSPTVAFWAAGSNGVQHVLTTTESLRFESRDRLVKIRLNKTRLEQENGGQPFSVTVRSDGEGESRPSRSFASDYGKPNPEYTPPVYRSTDDFFPNDGEGASDSPQIRSDPIVYLLEQDAETGNEIITVYTLFEKIASLDISVEINSKHHHFTHALKRDQRFSALIETVDARLDHVGDSGGHVDPDNQINYEISHWTIKGLVPFFQLGTELLSLARGAIDGFWYGAKSDAESLVELPGVAIAAARFYNDPYYQASVIYQIGDHLYHVDYKNLNVGQRISEFCANYLAEAERRAFTYRGNTDAAANAYIFGNVFGFAGEQAAVGMATVGTLKLAGATKAVLATAGAIEVGSSALSKARRLRVATIRFWKDAFLSAEHPAIEKLAVVLTGESVNGRPLFDIFDELLGRVGGEIFNHDVIAKEIAKYANGRVSEVGRLAMRRIANVGELLGAEASASSSLGALRVESRLIENGKDRFNDLLRLFAVDVPATLFPEGRIAFRKSLESFAAASTANPSERVKFFFKGVEDIYPKGYIYHDQVAFQRVVNGGGTYTRSETQLERGIYSTFDRYEDSRIAASATQVIDFGNTAKYRFEYDVVSVAEKVKVPYGKGNTAEFLEPVTRDAGGFGTATQVLVEQDIPINEIWDISIFPPKKKWDRIIGLVP